MSDSCSVLVVEDEYFLQADLEQTLNEAGFSTKSASSGEEALFLGNQFSCAALVTDICLRNGGLSGWDLARRMRAKQPALPVIYVTAVQAKEWAAQGVPNSILISKPFAPAQLVAALSSLLNIGNIGTPPSI